MSLTSLSEGTSVATALKLRCSAACVWGVGPPCSGGLSGAGAPLAFARATRRLGGVWRALLSIGRGGGGKVRRRLREAARAAGWSVALPEGGGKPGALLPTAGVNAGAPPSYRRFLASYRL